MMRSEIVDSSVIMSIGYDAQRRLLKVRFRNGRVYWYLDVPATTYRSLMTAASIGKYFNENVKPNHRAVRARGDGRSGSKRRRG
jgi:hypothetical protein